MLFKSLSNPYIKVLFIIILFAIIIYNSYIGTIEKRKDKDKEGFSDFIPDTSPKYLPNSLGAIFKHSDLDLSAYPDVDIKPGQLFLQDNKFLPECCFYYSDYSTDKGCPCITPEQQDYLLKRGLNKASASFVQEGKNYMNTFYSDSRAYKGKNPAGVSKIRPTNRELIHTPEAENNFYNLINMQGRNYGYIPEYTYIESKDECPATTVRNSLGVCVSGPLPPLISH